jgi:hypothetical protein
VLSGHYEREISVHCKWGWSFNFIPHSPRKNKIQVPVLMNKKGTAVHGAPGGVLAGRDYVHSRGQGVMGVEVRVRDFGVVVGVYQSEQRTIYPHLYPLLGLHQWVSRAMLHDVASTRSHQAA